jgi:hypothetical protein
MLSVGSSLHRRPHRNHPFARSAGDYTVNAIVTGRNGLTDVSRKYDLCWAFGAKGLALGSTRLSCEALYVFTEKCVRIRWV